jgi:hypothetical protein
MTYAFTTIDDTNDLTFNQLLGINNAGEIAGYFGSAMPPTTHPNKGYTVNQPYTQAAHTDENAPGSAQTQVTGLNSFGVTVGFAVDAAGNNTGFIDDNGTFTTVVDPNTPPGAAAAGTAFNQLLGINDVGMAVGTYNDANGVAHGYTYDIATAAFTQIDVAGATSTTTTGINNAGVISGIDVVGGVTEGFVDDAGTITQLTGPSGATTTQAFGLNNEGQVVGDYVDAAGNTHGFVYDIATGTYTTIDDPNEGTVGGVTSTVVNGINDQGQLVGFYTDAAGNVDGMLATLQATVQTVTDPTAGSVLAAAVGSGGVAAGGSNAVSLVDNVVGNVQLIANSGNDTLAASASGDTLMGGPGNDTFFTGVGTTGNRIFLGGGQNTVVTGGAADVVQSTGNDTVFASAGTFAFGGQAGSAMTFVANGAATAIDGAGSLVAFAGSASGTQVLGGAGSTTFVGGSGSASFIGGSGTAVVYAGSGGGLVEGGSGSGTYVGMANSSTQFVVGDGASNVFAANGNSVLLEGSATDIVVATGNVTLVGAGSSGSNVYSLGSSNALLTEGSGASTTFLGSGNASITGGAGADLFALEKGQGGGTDILSGFKVGTDMVQLMGYGSSEAQNDLAHASIVGGSTLLTLSDGTKLDFVGVTNLTSHSFG